MKNKKRVKLLVSIACFALSLFFLLAVPHAAYAADLDEIENYEITADVNDDATVTLHYHIDWRVLDSDSEGPLSWVTIGIPNGHYVSYRALSGTIRDISYTSSYGSNIRVDFDRNYYENEVVSFDFEVIQDYLYDMNYYVDGETVFQFTPGWFDDIVVDHIKIRWNGSEALSWSPACEMDSEGYLTWDGSLQKGGRYQVEVTYPNDAFFFDETKSFQDSGEYGGYDGGSDTVYILIGVIITMIVPVLVIVLIVSAILRYSRGANFGSTRQPKIIRTKIEYYPVCQGCGAARPEGKDNCPYCGRSFIKSKEQIEEKDIPREETTIREKKTDGTYRYEHSPNTYVHVHVIPVPRSSGHTVSRGAGSRSGVSRGAGSRSSSSHHSSCACACACACAGGGRAGCSVKDFYQTNLKLRYLKSNR